MNLSHHKKKSKMWGKHLNTKPTKRAGNSRSIAISLVSKSNKAHKENHKHEFWPVLRNGHYHVTKVTLSKLHVRGGRSSRFIQTAGSQFLAGAIGGGCATYTTHWLDTVKVRMQTNPNLYPSAAKCIRNTLQEGGVRGLYQGALPAVAGQTLKASIVFMSYGICQQTLTRLFPPPHENADELSVVRLAAAGAMTGVMASFALCPLELIKCRMQAAGNTVGQEASRASQRRGPLRLAVGIVSTEGVRGMYRGLPGMWAKEVPGSFIYFGSYEALKATSRQWFGQQFAASKTGIFLCGTGAGLCYCVTHPVESVKTRVQVESSSHGFFRASYNILKADGIKPLCRGIGPSMFRAGLYSGIQFLIYEVLRDALLKD